jgi:microcin C transport system permease protein
MRDYFIRRFMLILPTMIGATMIVYFVARMAPGGPVEAMMRARMALSSERSQRDAGGSLSEEQKEQLLVHFKFDKPYLIGYLMWLGVLPSEENRQVAKLEAGKTEAPVTLKRLLPREQWKPNNAYELIEGVVNTRGELRDKSGAIISGWKARYEPDKQRIVVFRPQFNGLFQGNLSYSTRYNDPVSTMILERVPISVFFGLTTFILTYVVCIPLGILKAIKHRTVIDNLSSVLIFIGYAVPGFVLGSILVVYLAARLGWFPTGGFTSENFSELSLGGKAWDLLHHGTLPLACYLVSNFAFMTMMMKNNLLDNLAADYVRTAIAKGSSFRGAVLRHALRNSLIPIVTTLGNIVLVFVTGSILIERVFDINGFGMLHFQAVLDRDVPLMLGILTIDVVLIMLGNILSDYLVASMDPRIRFD